MGQMIRVKTHTKESRRLSETEVTPAMVGSRLLTTGSVAELCQVAARTVSKWFDSGILPGHRIPGSLDRRFEEVDVVQFMLKYGIKLPPGLRLSPPIVMFHDKTYPNTVSVLNEFDLGVRCATHTPRRILSGTASSLGQTLKIASRVYSMWPFVKLAVVKPDEVSPGAIPLDLFCRVFDEWNEEQISQWITDLEEVR